MVEADTDAGQLLSMFVDIGIGGNGIIFTIMFAVICANTFITSEVDKGTLSVYLNTPTTRSQILLSRMLVFVSTLILFTLVVGIVGTVSPIMHGVEFNHGKWWTIVVLWMMYSILAGGITFAVACWFNKSRFTLITASAILGGFFLLHMLAAIDDLSFLRFLTLQTLFDTGAVLDGNSVTWQIIVMPVIAIPLYVFGVIKFLRKDLHI